MEEKHLTMTENFDYIQASLNTQSKEPSAFANIDPFSKSWDELKGLSGIDNNFRRRTARNIAKVASENPAYLESAGAVAMGDDAKSKQINAGTVYRNGYGLFDVITPPYNMYEFANFYDTNFANHAAIDAKVENVVGLGYRFDITDRTLLSFEMSDDEGKVGRARNRIERAKIMLRDWLESLNDDDSFTTTMEKVYTDLQATGNGFLEIGRKVNGEIGYVGHIPATTVRVRRLRDGFVQIIGNKIVYFRNFGAKNTNPVTSDSRPNEIIHLKQYSPLNTFYGIPDILAAMPALIGDQLASQYNIDYFENKAVPRYVITVKGAKLSADAEDKMFRFLQTGLKAQSHRTLYIPLPGDTENNKVEFKMEPIENGVQEGSFKEYRKQNRDDILIAHQVPISKLGGSDSAAIAAALSQDRTFKEQVSRPAQRYLEKMVNKIVKEKTDVLELKFNELTLTDEIAQSQILERYVKTQVMTPNEARDKLDLPQRPDGDMPFIMSPRQATDARADLAGNRQRDAERANNNSDSPSTISGRNPQGEGRSST
ncbi:MAG: phage portal protein [Alphaproteobacteria bacterium]|nr:phage portal protein [Alphaproteobacteria bacterium]